MIKRHDISSSLLGETLVRKKLKQTIDSSDQIRITPNLNVLKIGGYGIIDYGKKIVSPLVEEIGQLSKAFDKMTEGLKQSTISVDRLNEEIAIVHRESKFRLFLEELFEKFNKSIECGY